MGLLELFRPKSAPRRAEARRAQLFDDDFQKKLESLAIVEPARVCGPHARRAPQQEEGAAASNSPITVTTRRATTFARSTGARTSASASSWCGSTKKKKI